MDNPIWFVRRIRGRLLLARKWKYWESQEYLFPVGAAKVKSVSRTMLKVAATRTVDTPSGHRSRHRAFYVRPLRQTMECETRLVPHWTHRYCGRAPNIIDWQITRHISHRRSAQETTAGTAGRLRAYANTPSTTTATYTREAQWPRNAAMKRRFPLHVGFYLGAEN